MKTGYLSVLRDYLIISLGVFLAAFSIGMFFEPYDLVTGGVSGLAIVLAYIAKAYFSFDLPIWLTTLLLNLPLFVIGTKVLGVKVIKRTIFATVLFSFFLWVVTFIPPFEGLDYPLVIIYGGVIEGIGLGFVLRYFATTGGSDLLATIIHKKYKHLSVARVMFILDGLVVSIGFITFGMTKAMYGIITIFIISKVINTVLEGLSFAKATFIISDFADEICNSLFEKLDRGATGLKGMGMFTKKDKNVVLCVVSKRELVALKLIVASIDKNAFVIVADVREVLGEGFDVI